MRRSNQLNQHELNKISDKKDPLSFQECMELFLHDCKIRNLRSHTLKYYSNELNVFHKVLNEQGLQLKPSEVTSEHIKNNLILYMKEQQGLKTVTINTRLRAVRSFFNFLYKEKHIPKNPMETVKLLKERKTVIETFTRDQLKLLLKQPDLKTFTGLRDQTILLLFLETGVRVNELANIHISDVKSDTIRIRDAKTYRERLVPIQKQMKEQLNKWLSIRGIQEHDYLFVNIDGEPLAKRTVQHMVAKYGQRAKIKGVRCSCHTLRHTFARMSVENGATIFELQHVLGHTTFDQVRTYVNLFSNEVNESHKKFSPLRNLLK